MDSRDGQKDYEGFLWGAMETEGHCSSSLEQNCGGRGCLLEEVTANLTFEG